MREGGSERGKEGVGGRREGEMGGAESDRQVRRQKQFQ